MADYNYQQIKDTVTNNGALQQAQSEVPSTNSTVGSTVSFTGEVVIDLSKYQQAVLALNFSEETDQTFDSTITATAADPSVIQQLGVDDSGKNTYIPSAAGGSLLFNGDRVIINAKEDYAMLFGQKARIGGIQYTEGIIGHILKNVNPTNDNSAFSYSSGSSYYRRVADSELTYDRLLSDLEVIFDPARGSSSDKLVLCSLPVITFFNKMGDGKFVDGSLGHSNAPYKYDIESRTGAFGHKVMMIDTVHGTLNLVKEPLFRGISASYMLMADMKYLLYRPLVGNGYNRDTQIQTNVQSIDEDLRKDMIMTEAGLEVCLPESHALYDLEGV